MKEMRVRELVIDKAQDIAKKYNVWIDCKHNDNEIGDIEVVDGFVTVYAEEVLSETEKAIQVRLASGHTEGSVNGWKTWIPKSQIA